MDPAELAAISDFWDRHCDPDAWNFYAADSGNGDLFRFLTLLRPFRAMRAHGKPIRLITVSAHQAALCSLFDDVIDHIVCTPDARFSGRLIRDWRRATGRDHMRVGELINLYPVDYFQPPLDWGAWWYQLNDRGIFFIQLYKFFLGLQLDCAPSLPRVTDAARQKARLLFEQAGLPEGRTLLLFPYAKSMPFAQRREDVVTHFAALAAPATAAGLHVCTSIAPNELPIDGTDGVFIPLDVLIPFCDLAGNAVTVRSGISDILSVARCRKLHIYPSQWMADEVSPLADGLGGVEQNLSFIFAEENDPARFAARVMELLLGITPGEVSAFVPPRIRRLLAVPLERGDMNGRFRNEDFLIRQDFARLFRSGALTDGWSGLEDWGIWNLGYRATCYVRPATEMLPDLAQRPDAAVILMLDLTFAVSTDGRQTLACTIEVNGDAPIEHVARVPERWRVFRIPLPRVALGNPVRIIFTVDEPEEREAGHTPVADKRMLGLIRAAYEFEPAE